MLKKFCWQPRTPGDARLRPSSALKERIFTSPGSTFLRKVPPNAGGGGRAGVGWESRLEKAMRTHGPKAHTAPSWHCSTSGLRIL